MVHINYICNGCGLWSGYGDDKRPRFKELEVDMTSYLLFTSGFKLKEPKLKLHLCNECMAKVMDGEAMVRSIGDTETMRRNLEKLEKDKAKIERDFSDYRVQVASLLKPVMER